MSVRYFLTGATGFIGSHVAQKCVARGWPVTALVRPGSDARFLEGLGVVIRRGDLNDADLLRRVVEETPYPFAGEPNPLVRLGIASINGAPPIFADLANDVEATFLISDVGWFSPDSLYAYVQNRTQTWLDLVRINPSNGSTKRLFRDQTKAWIDNPGSPHLLADGRFLGVDHPECLAITSTGRTIGVAVGDVVEVVDLLVVTSLKPRSNGRTRSKHQR